MHAFRFAFAAAFFRGYKGGEEGMASLAAVARIPVIVLRLDTGA